MYQTAFGIHNNENITFLSLDAAEDYLIKNYPEYCSGKDATYDFCENMIWEDDIKRCEGCEEAIIYSDMTHTTEGQCWTKPSCCDVWFCNDDCHS